MQNSNPMFILLGHVWKTLVANPENYFLDYREYQIWPQGFLEAGSDGARSGPSVLHFVPSCLQSALSRRPKLRFGPE